jgi:hypothetical protein
MIGHARDAHESLIPAGTDHRVDPNVGRPEQRYEPAPFASERAAYQRTAFGRAAHFDMSTALPAGPRTKNWRDLAEPEPCRNKAQRSSSINGTSRAIKYAANE